MFGGRYADLPNPGLEIGVLLDASAQHAGRTGREILTVAARTMGLPTSRVAEMLARVSLATPLDHEVAVVPRPRREVSRIPTRRIIGVELRKMFDTRSGFWLMAGIVISSLLATVAVIIFAPDTALTYDSFGAAVGIPMVILLPVMAILSVTSEWSQRSGLTTFTLIPHRDRVVIRAKLLLAVCLGAVSIVVALGIGALGNVVGSAVVGVDTVWNISWEQAFSLVLGNVLGLLIGFMLGVLIRNSAAAIVAYFVYGFVLAGLTALLAASQEWFRDAQPWVDFNYTQGLLFEGLPSGEGWAQLAVTGVGWLVLPLAVGLLVLRRSEVK